MPKGDPKRVQNAIDYQGSTAQNSLNNIFSNLLPQNQQLQNRYNVAADQAGQDYSSIMQNYGNFMNGPGATYNAPHQNFGAYGGYQNFANTGGFSPQNIQDIRARSVAPMRAAYQNAQSDIDRQRSLQGGYSPNYTAAKAKMTRDLAYGLGDASTNTEAMLAEAIRSGKLAGLSGMTGIDTSRMQEGLENAGRDTSTQLANLAQRLQAMSGMTSLYGTTPGAANMYGNQLGQSNAQMNDIQQLQNQIAQMIINGQLGRANMNTRFDEALKASQATSNFARTAGMGMA